MAFKINRLLHLRDFDIEVGTLGLVHVGTLTSTQTATLTKAARDEGDAESLARLLLAQTASRVPTESKGPPVENAAPPSGSAIQEEEIARQTGAELDEFCVAFLSKNQYLLESQDGRPLGRGEGERGVDFLKRALRNHAEVEAAALKRIADSVSGRASVQKIVQQMSAAGNLSRFPNAATMEADLRNQVHSMGYGSLQQIQRDLGIIGSGTVAPDFLMKQSGLAQEVARISQYVSVDQMKAFDDWQRMSSNAEQHQRLVSDARRSAEAISKLTMPQVGLSMNHAIQQQYEHLFRFPAVGEAERLAAEAIIAGSSAASVFGATDKAILLDRMKAMHAPWLNTEKVFSTATAFADLQAVGYLANQTDSLGETISASLRRDLGDWRDLIQFEPESLVDPFTRSGIYLERGFNPRLTDFSVAAFDNSVTIAGLLDPEEEELELVDEAMDENGLARNRSAFDHLLRFEIAIRRFITAVLYEKSGPKWMKQRIHGDMLAIWRTKKEAAMKAGYPEQPLIDYADFSDYRVIIERQDNWEQAFKPLFGRAEDIRESFQRLYPVRIATMHARILTLDDHLLLLVETRRVLKVVERYHTGGRP